MLMKEFLVTRQPTSSALKKNTKIQTKAIVTFMNQSGTQNVDEYEITYPSSLK